MKEQDEDKPQKNAQPRGSALNELLAGMENDVDSLGTAGVIATKTLIATTRRLYAGNTELFDALAGMCEQYLSTTDDGESMHHDFISAGEYALKVLKQAGLVEECGGFFRFIKDGIGFRELS